MAEVNAKNINSLSNYIEIITGFSAERKCDLLHEDILFFRGIENKNFQLLPSIARRPNEHIHNSLLWFEKSMVKEAQRKRPDIFYEEEYPLNLLTKLQHYGIPTRLLDITTNGLAALFFACQNENIDGEVLVFWINKDKIHSNTSAIANTIATSYQLGTLYSFKELISRAEACSFFKGFKHKDVMKRFKKREEYLSVLEREYFIEPLFVLPQELSER